MEWQSGGVWEKQSFWEGITKQSLGNEVVDEVVDEATRPVVDEATRPSRST
jgi:hypothetical protein